MKTFLVTVIVLDLFAALCNLLVMSLGKPTTTGLGTNALSVIVNFALAGWGLFLLLGAAA